MAKQGNTPPETTVVSPKSDKWLPVAIALAVLLACIAGSLVTMAFISLMDNTAARTSTLAAEMPTAEVATATCNTECAPTATNAEPTAHDEVAWLIFGRNDHEGNYYMGIAAITRELLENGTPLQQFLSQITDSFFKNVLNLPETLENLNDSLKYVIIGDRAYKIPASGNVAIDSVSWVRFVEGKGLLICRDDTGAPGTWHGACGDTNPTWVTDWIPVDELLESGEFIPWAHQFTKVYSTFNGIFNDKIQLLVTYR